MRFKRTLIAWHFFGVLVILSLASLWNFFYSWAPNNFSAVIFPVNTSPWESLKLFLLPSIIFYIIEYIAIGRRFKNYLFAHGLTLIFMPILWLGMFYFYHKGLEIERSLIIDIVLLFVSICIGLYCGYKITIIKQKIAYGIFALIIAVILCAGYGVLTFFPPKKPMFQDPDTFRYGTEGFSDTIEDNR